MSVDARTEDMKATARRAIGLLDLTNLDGDCTHEAIDALCERAVTPHGPVAAICIWPRFVSHARGRLNGAIPIATVVNFPHGGTDVEITRVETVQALRDGAAEIDLVLPYEAFAEGDRAAAEAMVRAIRAVVPPAPQGTLKVILETGELRDEEPIRDASRLAIAAGADFIKTSTGKVAVNATPETARIMLEEIAAAGGEGGRTVGFKPAGGIRSTADAAEYLALADRIMGPRWAAPATFRFGASSVLADLLATLDGGTAEVGEGY